MDFQKRKTYYKDVLKSIVYRYISKCCGKVQTPMQQVMLQLRVRGMLPKRIDGIEMFGMYGLWHTMDYIKYVDSLDFFELNPVDIAWAKKNLRRYNVNFYCEDSIAYMRNTEKKYSFIVSDSPLGGDFYDEDGLPYFLRDMVNRSNEESVIIFNIKHQVQSSNGNIKQFCFLKDKINDIREAEDIFLITRNDFISYVVVIFS